MIISKIKKDKYFYIKDIKKEELFKGLAIPIREEKSNKKTIQKILCMGFTNLENWIENNIIDDNVYRELDLTKKYKREICYVQKRRYYFSNFI